MRLQGYDKVISAVSIITHTAHEAMHARKMPCIYSYITYARQLMQGPKHGLD